jgi:glutathione peroxidase-family protein
MLNNAHAKFYRLSEHWHLTKSLISSNGVVLKQYIPKSTNDFAYEV